MAAQAPPGCPLPRVTIQFCTQCKWMLRAAYFAQELLSTFSTALGEVALQPSTGGTFVVTITHAASGSGPSQEGDDASPSSPSLSPPLSTTVLWDRRVDGGFPETKELKRRVRDVVEPGRDLGHVDRHRGAVAAKAVADGGVKLAEGGGNDSNKGDKEDEEDKKGKEGKGGKVQQDKTKCEDCQ